MPELLCEHCGKPLDPKFYDTLLIAETIAGRVGLSHARVLYIVQATQCVKRSVCFNGGRRATERVQIHSLDSLAKVVLDYHKYRESIKRLGGGGRP